MSARYSFKTSILANRKPSSFKKNRFDKNTIKRPDTDSNWVRPEDWLQAPTILSSEQKVACLIPVYNNDSNWVAFSFTGNYTVDWGDGTVENFASGAVAQRNYNFSNANITSPIRSDGSKLVYAIITPQAGQTLDAGNFNRLPTVANAGTFPNVSPILEIIYSTPNGTTNLSIGNSTATNVFLKNLISFIGIHLGSGTRAATDLFRNCVTLINVDLQNVPTFNDASNMFSGCRSLINVSLFNTSSVTSTALMFQSCSALVTVPLFNTSSTTNMNNMFAACRSLKRVPLFNTSSVTNMSSMFLNCSLLTTIPLFNTSSVTNMSGMFQGCSLLQTVPLFNTSSVTNMANMFQSCSSLVAVPLFNTALVTTMSSMFNLCGALTEIPLFNTSSVTNMSIMFNSCVSLTRVPLFNTSLVTNMSSMFQGCQSLIEVPLFNTALVTNMSNMFNNCPALTTVPLFNTALVTITSSMFINCVSLRSVPLFNMSSVSLADNMFTNCSQLVTVPEFNMSAVTNMTSMFSGCNSLKSINFENVSAGTNVIKFSSVVNICPNLQKAIFRLAEYSLTLSSCNLSASALTDTMNALDNIVTPPQTLTISSNPGAPNPISVSGGTTGGTNSVSISNTTGIAIGMQVTGTGTGLTTGRAVTFTDAGDLVTLNNHGLQDGDIVMFSAITTTTGIVINFKYFVVGATTNTFQVALTAGGAAINLVSNGTGTVRYANIVTAINPNVSVTFDRPLASTGTNTLAFRMLPTRIALLKGWSVTG